MPARNTKQTANTCSSAAVPHDGQDASSNQTVAAAAYTLSGGSHWLYSGEGERGVELLMSAEQASAVSV